MGHELTCEFCGDTPAKLFLRSRCHPSAPLRAVKEGSVLVLRCYVPECDREVVRLRLEEASAVPTFTWVMPNRFLNRYPNGFWFDAVTGDIVGGEDVRVTVERNRVSNGHRVLRVEPWEMPDPTRRSEQ